MELTKDTLVLTRQEVQQISGQEIPVLNNKFLVGHDKITGDIILTPYSQTEFVIQIREGVSTTIPKHDISLTSPCIAEGKLIKSHSAEDYTFNYEINIKTYGAIPVKSGQYELREVYNEHIFVNGRLVAPHIIFAKIK